MFNDLISASNSFSLSAIGGSGRRLIIITGGRLVAVAGLLIAQLTDSGNIEGVGDVSTALASACSAIHTSLNPYQSNMLPTVGGGLNAQEASLVRLNWMQSLMEATGTNTGLGGEETEDVCSAIGICADSVDAATYGLLG